MDCKWKKVCHPIQQDKRGYCSLPILSPVKSTKIYFFLSVDKICQEGVLRSLYSFLVFFIHLSTFQKTKYLYDSVFLYFPDDVLWFLIQLSTVILPVPPHRCIRFFLLILIYFSHEREGIKMNSADRKDIEACMALIEGLERENKIQGRLIEAQTAMIRSLEEHNAKLEKIISGLSSI